MKHTVASHRPANSRTAHAPALARGKVNLARAVPARRSIPVAPQPVVPVDTRPPSVIIQPPL